MTKEEYFRIAENKPEITDESIYQLTIRVYLSDTEGYKENLDKQEWSYRIYEFSRYYSSKEKAEESYREYILNEKYIHSAIIERLGINLHVDEGFQLAWWVYDRFGKEIDKSFCTSLDKDEPTVHDVYFGRKPDDIPYEMGEIVEIIKGDEVYLEVLNGIPPTIEEMWEWHDERIKKWGEPARNKFSSTYFAEPMVEQYFYLRKDGFDPDLPPYYIMKPVFPIPEKAQKILSDRYNRWKSYMDSHSYKDINWDELYRIVRD